jgi:hypothetical protein
VVVDEEEVIVVMEGEGSGGSGGVGKSCAGFLRCGKGVERDACNVGTKGDWDEAKAIKRGRRSKQKAYSGAQI